MVVQIDESMLVTSSNDVVRDKAKPSICTVFEASLFSMRVQIDGAMPDTFWSNVVVHGTNARQSALCLKLPCLA
jgi:hypothetical protein